MQDSPSAVIAAVGAILAGVWLLFKLMLNQAASDRNADREERKAFVEAIERMAEASERVAEETAKGNMEAKERNGHIVELIIESRTQTVAEIIGSREKIKG